MKEARRNAARENQAKLLVVVVPLLAAFASLAFIEWRIGHSPFLADFLLGATVVSRVENVERIGQHHASSRQDALGQAPSTRRQDDRDRTVVGSGSALGETIRDKGGLRAAPRPSG